MPKHQSIKCEDQGEEIFDGQPITGGNSDGYYNPNTCCSIIFSIITGLAYILALLFIALVIFFSVFVSKLGMVTTTDISTSFTIPKSNESTWIYDSSDGGLMYPPYAYITFDTTVHNPNVFRLGVEATVDINCYEEKNENYTFYKYLDSINIEEIQFDADSRKDVHLEFNLTSVKLLKQIGLWLQEPDKQEKELKLQAFNSEAKLKFFKVDIDLPSYWKDVKLNISNIFISAVNDRV